MMSEDSSTNPPKCQSKQPACMPYRLISRAANVSTPGASCRLFGLTTVLAAVRVPGASPTLPRRRARRHQRPRPPTPADSITASAKPTISSGTKQQDSTLTGWTTSISAGDILRFNVDSITTITRCTVSLKMLATA